MSQYDFSTIICGLPRHGKTTTARREGVEHLTNYPPDAAGRGGGMLLVHDPHRDFKDFCAVYDDADAWKRALYAAVASKQPFPRGASIGGKGTAVRDAAVELGKARNTADRVRIPLRLVYDEGSLAGSSGSSHIADADVELLSNRAHWGIAVSYSIQRPTALTEAFYTMATDVYVYSMPSPRRTAALEEYLGLREGALDHLVGAPKFRYARWKQGEGLV